MSEVKEVIADRYLLQHQIGNGSYCSVYRGERHPGLDTMTRESVAIKFVVPARDKPLLRREVKLANQLETLCPQDLGFCRVKWYGHHKGVETSVTELLGATLLDKVLDCGGRLSCHSVLRIADQVLREMAILHRCKYLHKDLKPDNFLVGVGSRSQIVHMIDFSLAKKYIRKGKHVSARRTEFFGNPYWASVKVLAGLTASRQDELESLGLVFLFLLSGHLPWEHIRCEQYAEKKRRVLELRKRLTLERTFTGLPIEFAQIISYARSLHHDECPDYDLIRSRLRVLANSLSMSENSPFDWEAPGMRIETLHGVATCQQERFLASAESILTISEEKPRRKRAFSVDDEENQPLPRMTNRPDASPRSPSKERVSPNCLMRILATKSPPASPGLLLSKLSSQENSPDAVRWATSEPIPDYRSIEALETRRFSIAEAEEATDDEGSLPVLTPTLRGKIRELK